MQLTICQRHRSYVRQDLTNSLVDRATAYGMEVSTEKCKILTSSTYNISADICMNSQKLEEVTTFKYLGATLCKDGTCSLEVRIRIASAMIAMAGLNRIDRALQQHQLRKYVQAVRVSCHLHHSPWP